MQKHLCSGNDPVLVVEDHDIYAELTRRSVLAPFEHFLTQNIAATWNAIIAGCQLDVAFGRTAGYETQSVRN